MIGGSACLVRVCVYMYDVLVDVEKKTSAVDGQQYERLMAERRGRAAAAVSMQVKPETKAAAKGHNNANVVRHGQQHKIV